MSGRIGVVAIGRNEGDRLKACLGSVTRQAGLVVYVDSGSSDGSVQYAESLGIDVLELDMSFPFSAARARNDGFRFLLGKHPGVEYIQFIDGDCEMIGGWTDSALDFLEANPGYAIAAGRVKERHPGRSVYNRLCDIEWDTPVGDAAACGGIFMIRRSALEAAGGFDREVIAGEEPELCYRLGKEGWKIRRLDRDMVLHDSAMFRFSQWWKRSKRAGHAYAQGLAMHYRDGRGYCLRESRKSWAWGLALPLLAAAAAPFAGWYALLALALYPARCLRIAYGKYRRIGRVGDSFLYGLFTALASWPQLAGQMLYLRRRLAKDSMTIIEHK